MSELCSVTQLPQSTVSRHLKTLGEDGWIGSRRDGTSRFYTMAGAELTPEARALWTLIETQLGETPEAEGDQHRVEGVLALRRTRAREFFATAAGEWDRMRSELYGKVAPHQALLSLLDDRWEVADLGCGTGEMGGRLAPCVGRVVLVDGSEEMLAAARVRLSGLANVEFRQGELEELPLAAGGLDAAVLSLVLHFVPDPAAVLREAGRVLRPGGRLLLLDLLPHDREEYREMGHVWLGFSEAHVQRLLGGAGFTGVRIHPLPADPLARGPGLFAASARR